MKKNFLFVCGCPRSGTTALWRLLSNDQNIRLGVERYGNRFFSRDFLTPDLFEKERFFDNQKGDTFYSDLKAFNRYYEDSQEGYDDATYFGDKIPKLYEYLDRLNENFEGPKTIFIFRNIFDVAASYKVRQLDETDNWSQGVTEAIAEWNTSLKCAEEYDGDMLLVDYERLFMEGQGLERIYAYLDLEVTEEIATVFRHIRARSDQLESSRPRALTALEVKEICTKADFTAYQRLVQRVVE